MIISQDDNSLTVFCTACANTYRSSALDKEALVKKGEDHYPECPYCSRTEGISHESVFGIIDILPYHTSSKS